ncbi:hypothetical protein CIB48_g7056, partial [Xylaria polymorpha]
YFNTDHQHPSNVELIWQQAGLKETGQLQLSVPEFEGNGESKYWQKIFISIDPKRINSTSGCNAAPNLPSSTKSAPNSTSVVPTKRKLGSISGLRGLFPPNLKIGKPPAPKQVVSLQLERLRSGQNGHPNSKQVVDVRLSRKERLGVAAAAVWAVLVLCGTPWLEESWLGKEDISLLVEVPTQGNGFGRPKTYPSLSHIFTPQQEITSQRVGNHYPDNSRQFQIRHKTLFALGVLLIELGLNKAFHQIRADTNTGDPINETSIQDDYITAKQVIDSEALELELGESYANAVQRCIQCHFLGPESMLRMAVTDPEYSRATFDAQITSVIPL